MKKDSYLSIRISSEHFEIIKQKAKQAKLSQSDYVTSCCLGQQIIVFNGLKELLSALRYIGNRLNQAVVLAHTGRISCIDLSECSQQFKEISQQLKRLLEKGNHKWRS